MEADGLVFDAVVDQCYARYGVGRFVVCARMVGAEASEFVHDVLVGQRCAWCGGG